MRKTHLLLWGLFLLLIVRLLAMAIIPLTDPTEARYAEIARKMVETGNWITPQFDYGVPFWAKPPLSTWVSAIGIMLLGDSAFAARFGVLLTSCALLAILWFWLKEQTDRVTALAAIAVTASTSLFYVATAYVQTDMVLSFGVVTCMAGFYSGIQGKRGWGWLFFVGLAIGLLAKGPIGVVLSVTPIFLWLCWQKQWRSLKFLPWTGGMALVLVLVVPWYVAAEIATPGFLHYFIIGEHIQRFLQPGWSGDLYGAGREQFKGAIWLFWLLAAFPWSPLLPFLLWRLRKGVPATVDKPLYTYLLLFALFPLLFFTPSANILITYVLPGLPAAAVLGTMLWRDVFVRKTIWLKLGMAEVMVIVLSICLASLAGFASFLPSQHDIVEKLPDEQVLGVWDDRNFSAEFYRHGKVRYLSSETDARQWLENGNAILVAKSSVDKLPMINEEVFRLIGENKDYYLYAKR